MGRDERASVVVVGAGAVGLAVALQLRKAGVTDVLVVDRNESPGMGSTSRANGGVRAQFTTPINIEFSRFTIGELRALHDETSGQVGFRPIGYLFMTGTAEGAAALRRAWELQRSLGVAVEWLEPDGVAEIAPFVNTEGLLAGTFFDGDGIIDPSGVVSALSEAGRRLGVSVRCDTAVIDITDTGGSHLVRTTRGDIDAAHVINAAGPFARAVAATVGIDLPVTPRRRNLACTEPVAGMPDPIPMCVDNDTGVLIRREAGGFLVGYSDPHDPESMETGFDPAFLDVIARRVGHRFPFLEDVPINARKCWAGLYPETPDHHAIIDAPPGAPWFIQCVGFGGHGIMHSLAAGQAVAELVSQGRCTTFDLRALRLDRFDEPGGAVETAVL
jgi:sarcosine oxidase, subunit beta